MSNIVKVDSGNLANEDKDLLYFLQKFDEHSIEAITDLCQNYPDEKLAGIVFFLDRLKKRAYLYQWAVIATKAYKIRAYRHDKKKDCTVGTLEEELVKAFPAYKKSSLYNKLTLWDTFYQDLDVKWRAKWNKESYIFEDIGYGAEVWYFLVYKYTRETGTVEGILKARDRLRKAEDKYILTQANGGNYNSQDLRMELVYERDSSKIIPPFRRINTELNKLSKTLDNYLESFEYDPNLKSSFTEIRNDIEFLAAECLAIKGVVSLEDLELVREKSRISHSSVDKIDIEKILDPEV